MTILTVYYEPNSDKLGARRDKSKNTPEGQALYPVSTFNAGFGVTSY